MKYILIVLMLFITINTNETNNDIDFGDFDVNDNTLLYASLWAEARGLRHTSEFVATLDTYRNRVNSSKWPSTLDSVVIQKHQFAISKDSLRDDFKHLVDSLLTLPITYPYTYFVCFKKLKKVPKWVKHKKWHRKKGWQQHYAL